MNRKQKLIVPDLPLRNQNLPERSSSSGLRRLIYSLVLNSLAHTSENKKKTESLSKTKQNSRPRGGTHIFGRMGMCHSNG